MRLHIEAPFATKPLPVRHEAAAFARPSQIPHGAKPVQV